MDVSHGPTPIALLRQRAEPTDLAQRLRQVIPIRSPEDWAREGRQLAGGDKRAMSSAAIFFLQKNGGGWLHNDVVLWQQVDDNLEPIRESRCLPEKAATMRRPPSGSGWMRTTASDSSRKTGLHGQTAA